MNRLLAMLVVIAAAIVARADVWTDPQTGIQWTYTPLSDTEASLGDGGEAAISTDTAGELTLPSSVNGLTVTRISSCAFAGCDKLTAVTIPDSVVSAERDSFEDCTSLWKVTIPYRFANRIDYCCMSPDPSLYQVALARLQITEVIIAEGVTSINGAFANCETIQRVTIPSSVKTVGWDSFAGCTGLGHGVVVVSGCVVRIDDEFAEENVVLPPGTHVIEAGAYEGLSGIRSIVLPSGLEEIPRDAFCRCSDLSSVTIPESVSHIGGYAFEGTKLVAEHEEGLVIVDGCLVGIKGDCPEEVDIPEGVRLIADGVFSWEDTLETVRIPKSLVQLGDSPFGDCGALKEIVVDEGNPNYKSVNGLLLTKDGKTLLCGLNGDVTIPEGVTTIGESAFCYSPDLDSVMMTIPASVTSVEEGAFGGIGSGENIFIFKGLPPLGLEDSWLNGIIRYDPAYTEEWEEIAEYLGLVVLPFGAPLPDGGPYRELVDGISWSFMVADGEACVGWDPSWGDMPAAIPLKTVGAITVPTVLGECPVTGIEVGAFSSCSGLTAVIIHNGVKRIGEGGIWWRLGRDANGKFYYDDRTYDVVAESSGRRWADEAALLLPHLRWETKIIGGNSVPLLALSSPDDQLTETEIAYLNFLASKYCYRSAGRWCTEICVLCADEVPADVFEGCTSLRSVTVPACVKSLKTVFPNYADLTSVTLADGVTTVYSNLLFGCENVENVTVPASVTSVEPGAFAHCGKLKNVTFLGDRPDFGEGAFCGTPRKMTLTVSEDSLGWDDDELLGRTPPWGRRTVVDGSGGQDPAVVVPTSVVVVSNVVVHYVMNSVMSSMAAPVTEDVGIVNVMTEIKGGNVAVPDSWSRNYPEFAQKFGTEFAAALTKPSGKTDAAGNPMLVWQDYVAGTDPTDKDDVFKASVTIVDGKPVVSYTPELTEAEKARRIYRKYGKVRLGDDSWTLVPEGSEADYNFFKVTVEMK